MRCLMWYPRKRYFKGGVGMTWTRTCRLCGHTYSTLVEQESCEKDPICTPQKKPVPLPTCRLCGHTYSIRVEQESCKKDPICTPQMKPVPLSSTSEIITPSALKHEHDISVKRGEIPMGDKPMRSNQRYHVVHGHASSMTGAIRELEREVQSELCKGAILQGGVSISGWYECEDRDITYYAAAQAFIITE
jgi:hypothetical protein